MSPDARKNGAAMALSDMVNRSLAAPADPPAGTSPAPVAPEEPAKGAAEETRSAPAKKTTKPKPAPRAAGRRGAPARSSGWAGPVARRRVEREQLNAGIPVELDLLRRLRRHNAETGIPSQDFVAWALHEALNDLGYFLDDDEGAQE